MAPRGGSKSVPTHEAALTTLTSTARTQGDLLLRYMAMVKELEAALWVALDGREIVVRESTPRAIEWSTTEDGGRMVRRANR